MFFSNLLGSNEGLVSDGGSSFWRRGVGSSRSAAGVTVTPDTALAITVLQTCVTLLAESVGQLPLELYRRLGDGKRESQRLIRSMMFCAISRTPGKPLMSTESRASSPWACEGTATASSSATMTAR